MRRHSIRWLFVSPAQLGRLLVQLALVEELRRRGDEVYVYAPASARKHIEAAGGTAVDASDGPLVDIEMSMHAARERAGWTPPSWASPRVRLFLEKRERELRFRRTVQEVTERTARQTSDLVERLGASAVVAEMIAFGARFGAKLAGVPFATVGTDPNFAYDSRGMPLHLPDRRIRRLPPGVWHRVVDAAIPLGCVRHALGLPRREPQCAADFYSQMVSPELHIVVAPAWFMGESPGPAHAYVGPMAFSPADGAGAVKRLEIGRSTILVTGSTTGHPRARMMLTNTVRAFAGTELDVVVAAGSVRALLGELPKNIRVIEGFVRHEDIISRVGVVVSHGGWGTVGRAIRRGTPSLVVPAFGPQIGVARRIEATGLGRMLLIEQLSPDRVRDAVRDLLTSDRVRRTTKRVAEELALPPGPAARAADALASLLASRER